MKLNQRLVTVLVFALVFVAAVASAASAASTTYLYLSENDGGFEIYDPVNFGIINTGSNGASNFGIAGNPAGSKVYMADNIRLEVNIYNPASTTKLKSIGIQGAIDIAFDATGSTMYVADYVNDRVVVVNAGTDTVTGYITVGDAPWEMVMSPNFHMLAVHNSGDNTVSFIDTTTNTVVATRAILAGFQEMAVNSVGNRLVVLCNNNPAANSSVYTFDMADADQVALTTVCLNAQGITVDYSGVDMWVGSGTDKGIYRYSMAGTYVDMFSVPDFTPGYMITSAANRIYIKDDVNKTIKCFDGSDKTLQGTITCTMPGDRLQLVTGGQSSSWVLTPQEVSFVVHDDRTVKYSGVNVSVYEGGVLYDSKLTGSDGSASFVLMPDTTYTVAYERNGATVSFTVVPVETRYWISWTDATITPDSQYQQLNPLHYVTVTIIDWWSPVKACNVNVYQSGNTTLMHSGITDDKGEVSYNLQYGVLYRFHIYNASTGLNTNRSYTASRDTLTISLYEINLSSWTPFNGGIIDNDSTVGFMIVPDIHAVTNESGTYITCNIDDRSGLATSMDYELLTWAIGENTTTSLSSATVSGSNTSTVFTVANPNGKNYEVRVVVHQPKGDVNLYYDYTWPGPNWRLPGVPVELYQWISLFLIGAVFLGTSRRLNIGLAGITASIITAFLATSGWMYAWGLAIWPAVTFTFIMSVLFYWKQVQNKEV